METNQIESPKNARKPNRMLFGTNPFNMDEGLWWEILEEGVDYKMLRMEKAIEYSDIQERGFNVGPKDTGPMITWLSNHFAWQAFGYREGAYVQRIGLLHEADEDKRIHPVIWIDPDW